MEQVPQKPLLHRLPRFEKLTEPVKARCYRQRQQDVDLALRWRSLELQVLFAVVVWEERREIRV